MRLRWATLLVSIYLVLDFANPMMPGAVQLIHGSLQIVAGCGVRGGERPTLARAVILCHPKLDLTEQQPAVTASWRVVSAPPPVPVLFRALFEPRSTQTSSPDDD
jgi:hypothetical protein